MQFRVFSGAIVPPIKQGERITMSRNKISSIQRTNRRNKQSKKTRVLVKSLYSSNAGLNIRFEIQSNRAFAKKFNY